MQVYGYCMYKDGQQAKVAYPTESLPPDIAGRSFHNGRFVQRLRQAAAAQPSITVRQGVATALLNGVWPVLAPWELSSETMACTQNDQVVVQCSAEVWTVRPDHL